MEPKPHRLCVGTQSAHIEQRHGKERGRFAGFREDSCRSGATMGEPMTKGEWRRAGVFMLVESEQDADALILHKLLRQIPATVTLRPRGSW